MSVSVRSLERCQDREWTETCIQTIYIKTPELVIW